MGKKRQVNPCGTPDPFGRHQKVAARTDPSNPPHVKHPLKKSVSLNDLQDAAEGNDDFFQYTSDGNNEDCTENLYDSDLFNFKTEEGSEGFNESTSFYSEVFYSTNQGDEFESEEDTTGSESTEGSETEINSSAEIFRFSGTPTGMESSVGNDRYSAQNGFREIGTPLRGYMNAKDYISKGRKIFFGSSNSEYEDERSQLHSPKSLEFPSSLLTSTKIHGIKVVKETDIAVMPFPSAPEIVEVPVKEMYSSKSLEFRTPPLTSTKIWDMSRSSSMECLPSSSPPADVALEQNEHNFENSTKSTTKPVLKTSKTITYKKRRPQQAKKRSKPKIKRSSSREVYSSKSLEFRTPPLTSTKVWDKSRSSSMECLPSSSPPADLEQNERNFENSTKSTAKPVLKTSKTITYKKKRHQQAKKRSKPKIKRSSSREGSEAESMPSTVLKFSGSEAESMPSTVLKFSGSDAESEPCTDIFNFADVLDYPSFLKSGSMFLKSSRIAGCKEVYSSKSLEFSSPLFTSKKIDATSGGNNVSSTSLDAEAIIQEAENESEYSTKAVTTAPKAVIKVSKHIPTRKKRSQQAKKRRKPKVNGRSSKKGGRSQSKGSLSKESERKSISKHSILESEDEYCLHTDDACLRIGKDSRSRRKLSESGFTTGRFSSSLTEQTKTTTAGCVTPGNLAESPHRSYSPVKIVQRSSMDKQSMKEVKKSSRRGRKKQLPLGIGSSSSLLSSFNSEKSNYIKIASNFEEPTLCPLRLKNSPFSSIEDLSRSPKKVEGLENIPFCPLSYRRRRFRDRSSSEN